MKKLVLYIIIIIIFLPSVTLAGITERKFRDGIEITLEHFSHGRFQKEPRLIKRWDLMDSKLLQKITKATRKAILTDEAGVTELESQRRIKDMYILSLINHNDNSITRVYINENYITAFQSVYRYEIYKDKMKLERFLWKESKKREDVSTDTMIKSIESNEIVIKYQRFRTIKQNPTWKLSTEREINFYKQYLDYISDSTMIRNGAYKFDQKNYFKIITGKDIYPRISSITVGQGIIEVKRKEFNIIHYKGTEDIFKNMAKLVNDKHTYDD